MMELLEFKEKLKALYARFGAFAGPAIKFLLGFLSVVMLNQNLGFMARIDNMPAALFLGIVCMALPYGGMALLAGLVMLAHIGGIAGAGGHFAGAASGGASSVLRLPAGRQLSSGGYAAVIHA